MFRPKGRKKIFPRHGSGFDIEAVRILKARAKKEGRPISEILEDAKIKNTEMNEAEQKPKNKKAADNSSSKSFGITRDEMRKLLKEQE